MDGRNDSFALLGQVLEQEDDLKSSGGIQPSCRFVQENDGRVGNKLNTNRSTFPFSSTDSLDEGIAHLHICAADEPKFVDQILHNPLLFCF